MDFIINKEMTTLFTDEEKETVVNFHELINKIRVEMEEESIEEIEINSMPFSLEEISEIEEQVWYMF